MPEVNYCPLCLAHPIEHGEGREQDTDVLVWADDIVALYDRLQALRSPDPEPETQSEVIDAH